MREELWKLLTDAVIEVLQCDVSELDPETSFEGDLGADSLDAYQIILQIQEKQGVEFDPDRLRGLVTLQDAYDLMVQTEDDKKRTESEQDAL